MSFCNNVAEQSHLSVPTQCSHQEMFYPLQEHDYDGDGLTVDRHEVHLHLLTKGCCSIKKYFFCIAAINMSAFICRLFRDHRKLTLLTAVEIFYMQKQVRNQIGLVFNIFSASCLGFSL